MPHSGCCGKKDTSTNLQLYLKILNLDILNSTSFDWNSIVYEVSVYTTDKKQYYVDGANISWSILPTYPACQSFDILDYFDFKSYTPLQVFLHFNYSYDTSLITIMSSSNTNYLL